MLWCDKNCMTWFHLDSPGCGIWRAKLTHCEPPQVPSWPIFITAVNVDVLLLLIASQRCNLSYTGLSELSNGILGQVCWTRRWIETSRAFLCLVSFRWTMISHSLEEEVVFHACTAGRCCRTSVMSRKAYKLCPGGWLPIGFVHFVWGLIG
jgi:hypothetical protein